MSNAVTGANQSAMFQVTQGKPAVAPRPLEDMKPYYSLDDYVEVQADASPGNNRPPGRGRVVAARGTGTGTIVDVAYDKAFDDGVPVLPDGHPLKGAAAELGMGRVHRNVPFSDVTRVPDIIGRGIIPTAKRQRRSVERLAPSTPVSKQKDKAGESGSPAQKLVENHRRAIRLKFRKGWRWAIQDVDGG
jgi:hypothetical protein